MDSKEINISPATASDASGIYNVRRETWLATYPNEEYDVTVEAIERKFPPEDIEKTQKIADRIIAKKPTEHEWVAKHLDEVVGWVAAKQEGNEADILALYVLPDYQRHQVGRKLIKIAIEWAGEDKKIRLEVASYNTKAIRFYEKLGFKFARDIPHDYSVEPPEEIIIPHTEMIRLPARSL